MLKDNYLGLSGLFVLFSSLHLGILHQPVAKELDWIARLLFAGLGETFGQDHADVGLGQIRNVWVLMLERLVRNGRVGLDTHYLN